MQGLGLEGWQGVSQLRRGVGGEVGLPGRGTAWRWPQKVKGVEREEGGEEGGQNAFGGYKHRRI